MSEFEAASAIDRERWLRDQQQMIVIKSLVVFIRLMLPFVAKDHVELYGSVTDYLKKQSLVRDEEYSNE